MGYQHVQRVRSDAVGGAGDCLLRWCYKLVDPILIHEYWIDEQEQILKSKFCAISGQIRVKY